MVVTWIVGDSVSYEWYEIVFTRLISRVYIKKHKSIATYSSWVFLAVKPISMGWTLSYLFKHMEIHVWCKQDKVDTKMSVFSFILYGAYKTKIK
jgi:hypothetical protein